MSRPGLMKKAIAVGGCVGALAGYVEAVSLILFSKLYFTPAGKLGLMITAAAIYAVYGMLAAALLSRVWLLFRPRHSERAGVAAAVLAISLLYSMAILFSLGILSRSSLFSMRLLLWGFSLLAASIIVAYLSGFVAGAGRRASAMAACLVIILGIAVFLPRGKEARPEEGMPDVVLVTIDTIRGDRIHCYGYERIKTPVLDRLASEGVLFENAICQIPITNPSHLSLLSSRYPHQTGVIDNWYRRPPGINTIVDEFRKRGYTTAAFVSAFPLDSRFGFAEGFDIYDDDFSKIKGCQSLSLVRMADTLLRRLGSRFVPGMELQRDAGRTNSAVLSWLKGSARSPFFLWVHYFDPHGPYTPPPPYSEMYYSGVKDDPENRSMDGMKLPDYWMADQVDFTDIEYPVAQYDAEITYTDAELGTLVEALDGSIEDYILVVVGDHGESLTEHGLYFHHGPTLYEEQLRVPLIIRSKGRIKPSRVSSLVENIDISPTMLEVAGLGVPVWCQGESLFPLMRGGESRSKEGVLSESGGRRKDGTIDIAYRTERYKLIMKPGEGVELYDLEEDPNELRDISGERADIVEAYEEIIRSILASQVGEAGTVMDHETEEKLRSLGYLR